LASLILQDILKRPTFAEAKVVAGHNGLNRRVRWVHILEVSEFDTLINGEEMILATGIHFQSSSASPARYLEKLIRLNASCLCLELGYYFHTIPDDLIQIANRHDFPLIVFPNDIRFVDITQDLHSVLINKHFQILKNLEALSREFHRLSLEPNGTNKILKMLYYKTHSPILYLPYKDQPSVFPKMEPEKETELIQFLNDKRTATGMEASEHRSARYWPFQNQYILLQPVSAMGQTWAHIGMLLKQKPTRYEFLILDWTSLAIAQDLLRKRYIEERRLHSENVWVDDLLHNRLDESQIHHHLGADFYGLNHKKSFVCLIEWLPRVETKQERQEVEEYLQYDFPIIIRAIFEQHHFYPLITRSNQEITIIAFDLESDSSWKSRVSKLLKQLKKQSGFLFKAGVGQRYNGFASISQSYQEARQVLDLNTRQSNEFTFYDELGVFQLIMNLKDKDQQLKNFIHQHLGPVIEHDQKKNSHLLYTLKVYLDHNGSKKAAADHLYIARQSLYYRLEKLQELLGDGFLTTENQLTLQTALKACQLIYPELLTGRGENPKK
jgi:PucR family transcriptional regulator, purine catabolism regulatory protein